jgi:aminodeoxyfutalosine synthase
MADVPAYIMNSGLNDSMKEIAGKVFSNTRITPEEGLLLFEKGEPGLLGVLAEYVKQQNSGDEVYYIRNFHLEPTNICVNKCNFCSYSHHFSPKKWNYTMEEMIDMVKEQDPEAKEIHITGAVHPDRDIYFYDKLFRRILELRPSIHIKALSAVELEYLVTMAKMNRQQGLKFLKESGLGSIPGGGAEILVDEIRKKICPTKVNSKEWLEIHESAHQMGISSNATMLYGHIETYSDRIKHMDLLRDLQDRTHGFNAFIPLKFRHGNNHMAGIRETVLLEDMRNYAVSRIFLDNIPHLKGYWPATGKAIARLALSFGVDDLDGTISDSTRIYSLAGSQEQNPSMTVSEMEELIRNAGRIPVERDSLYYPVNTGKSKDATVPAR